MAKDPAILLYTSDFLTGTIFMTDEQVGIYARLLFAQHQLGGIIDKISFNSRVGNHDIVRQKFIETDDGFYNRRMMEEMEKRSNKVSNLSSNAKKRWEKEKQKQCNCITNECDLNMHTESENENEDINISTIENFEKFWNLYPSRKGKKVGKAEAKKEFVLIKDFGDLMIATENYAKSQMANSGFAKDAKRFLSNDYWKDWIDGTDERSVDKKQKDIDELNRLIRG